jgi:precorrin isomerase
MLQAFTDGFAKKIASGLDIMAMHGLNPATMTAATTAIGNNHFDTVTAIAGTADLEEDFEDAAAGIGDYDVTGIAISKACGKDLAKIKVNGVRQYPEFRMGANPGALNGIACDVNATVSKAATGVTPDAAIVGDFVTAVYNPKSHGRYWQLYRLQELFLQERSAETPIGYVRQAGRPEQEVRLTTLGLLDPEEIDMFTVLIIGNSQSYQQDGKMVTPRGYYRETMTEGEKIGQSIMIESFRTIAGELHRKDWPLDHKWALLHAIHTTADFDMENILHTDNGAVAEIYNKVAEGTLRTIITDVTMVVSGIRKGALARLGVEAKCYLGDPRVAEMAQSQGITRTQAGIRLAVEEHPDALFAFGNAPTALMELCELICKGKARPAGIIAAPVGFVHVRESKHMVKPFRGIPKIIVEGRKGGSNLAATLCNAILTFNDAEQLRPGRDL